MLVLVLTTELSGRVRHWQNLRLHKFDSDGVELVSEHSDCDPAGLLALNFFVADCLSDPRTIADSSVFAFGMTIPDPAVFILFSSGINFDFTAVRSCLDLKV